MLNNALFQIHILQLWLFQILMWTGRNNSYAVYPRIWSHCTFSKYLYVWGRVFLMMTTKQNIDHRSRLIPKDDMRVSLSTTVSRKSNLVRRKQARKTHYWVTDWFEIVCHFSEKEKFKHGCVFLLPNVSPFDSVDSVICRFAWNCFRNFNNLSEPLLKSIHACS